ncbi:MAG: glycosyltransferase family 4 protein [Acidobacteriota bacterium]|nr:glycosyltransferase family 4 protein [Acidobacteriota bacterium]
MTADTVGGVWTYAQELAAALEPSGIQVCLATMGGPAPRCDLSNVQVFESEFRLEWMEEPWEDVRRAGEWLIQLDGEVRPDIIHLNGYVHGALNWSAPVVMVGHSCVLSWWKAVRNESAPKTWDRYRAEVRRGLQSADTVIAPSQAMLASLESNYGPFRSSTVIPNARRTDLYSNGNATPDRRPAILTAGRLWDDAKNVSALASVAGSIPWPIYVAGDAHHPDGSVRDVTGLQFLGRLHAPELACWYARASIYALPARYEPFGLSVLEAAISGCALVLGDIESLRENWDGAALFVSPDDHGALSRALNLLIEDSALRHDLAARAKARAAKFAPDRMAASYLQAYRSVTSDTAAEMLACA